MAPIKVESTSRAVRAYIRAVVERDRAELTRKAAEAQVAAAEAQIRVCFAALTGGQRGEAERLLKAMNTGGGA